MPRLPNRGLTTNGGSSVAGVWMRHVPCRRMGYARVLEQPGRHQLVVGSRQRPQRVEHPNAFGLQARKLPGPGLDAVDGREHVEASQRGVAVAEAS